VRLSIVIPTLDRPDALPRTLDHLDRQGQSPESFELIVVEDANNQHPPAIGERPYRVRVMKGSRPGAASARNVGWRAADAPIVLFLGDDILAAPDLLERHLAAHERHPGDESGVLGHVRWARELRRTAFMTWLDYGIQFDYGSIEGDQAGPGHFYTANVSLKRAALERVEGFDEETFPFGYEDIDLGLRLFQRGFRLLYEPLATGEHLHEPRLENWRKRMAFVAPAERRWVELYPAETPYFHDRLAEALELGPRRGRLGTLLLHRVPPGTPLVWERIWENADIYFRQQLGRPFMDAWNASEPR
jgi:GT2 family glycosyltransferase